LSRQCGGFKRDGERCTATVNPPQTFCWWHDPANAEQRQQAASKAARSKPNRSLQVLSDLTDTLYKELRSGAVDPKIGAVLTQLINTKARVLELGRRIKETEELEARIDALELADEGEREGARRWG